MPAWVANEAQFQGVAVVDQDDDGTGEYGLFGELAGTYPPGDWDQIIENQDFTSTLSLDTGDDNTLIIGSTFHDIEEGRGIEIRNVSNVYIKDSTFYNITGSDGQGNGISLRSSGSTAIRRARTPTCQTRWSFVWTYPSISMWIPDPAHDTILQAPVPRAPNPDRPGSPGE